MFNNEDDNENINVEKFLPNDDLNKDYSFEEEEDYGEAINGDNESENLKKILMIII